MKRIRDIGEIGLIKRLARSARSDRTVVKGIGDDTAVIAWTKKEHLLFTCDMLIEDVHFTRKTATPFQIGWKAMARNISDIAAMGGLPRYALVAAALDPALPVRFADELYRGMRAVARRFGVGIVGGDTAHARKLCIDISLIGMVEKKRLVLRSRARPGDLILVTGAIGGSRKGKHLNFMPRVSEARRLVTDGKVSAMIDISDGLLLDLSRILDASGVGGRLCRSLVPLAPAAASFDRAVTDGEDFELLLTMSVPAARRFFRTALSRMATPVTVIGEIKPRRYGLMVAEDDGRERPVTAKGYLHF